MSYYVSYDPISGEIINVAEWKLEEPNVEHLEISATVYKDIVVHGFHFTVDTKNKTLKDDTANASLAAEVLAAYKIQAQKHIDGTIGNIRARHITDIPGQSEVYVIKAKEAQDYKNQGYPLDLTNFPYIRENSAITGDSPREIADDIINRQMALMTLNAGLEAVRLKYKKEIKLLGNTNTERQVDLLVENFKNELTSLKLK